MLNQPLPIVLRSAYGILIAAMAVSASAANGPPSKSPIEARQFIEKVDADLDGRISLTEWSLQGLPEDNYRLLDEDADGLISFEELTATPPVALDATRDGELYPRELLLGRAHKMVAPDPQNH